MNARRGGTVAKPDWDGLQEGFYDFLQHVTIISKDEGRVRLEMYDAQRYFFDEVFDGLRDDIHWFVCGKGRQLGITSACLLFDVFYAGAVPDIQAGFVVDTDANKQKFRKILKEMIASLPPSHRLQIAKGGDNREGLTLENGNMLDYLTAGTKRGQGTLGRSRALNYVHATECRSWGDEEAVESFRDSLSEIFPWRLYLFESTGYGYNLFYDLWEEAVADELTKKAIFIGWWRKRTYSHARNTALFKRYGWPDRSKDEREIEEAVFREYGHKITDEQWAWYRHRADPIARAEERHDDEPEEFRQEVVTQEHPSCVVGDTRVGTENGIIPICEAHEGLSATIGTVAATGPTGRADVFRLTTKRGYTVVGTADHPIALSDDSFRGLTECVGSQIKLCRPKTSLPLYTVAWRAPPALCRVLVDETMAVFVGLFMGDGSYSGSTLSVIFDAKDEDVISLYRGWVLQLFDLDTTTRPSGHKSGGVEVRARCGRLKHAFDAMGLITRDVWGSIKRRVHVPEFIFRSPLHVIAGFLRGLFDSDGFVSEDGNRIVLAAKDKDFLCDVQLLLLAFGITCSLKQRNSLKEGIVLDCYTLELRALETDAYFKKIGFISDRKNQRRRLDRIQHPNLKPLVLEDDVISVEPEGKSEVVWNMTISGTQNVFDAGGILTHNTPEQMFRGTGSPFIPNEYIAPALHRAQQNTFHGYRYHLGDDVSAMTITPVKYVKFAQLKVYEPPSPIGVYILGADTAYGISDRGDANCAQIVRCFADKMVQVAEFNDRNIQPFQFAWVLLHLCGWYGNCRYVLELNGSGEAVWTELKTLKRMVEEGRIVPPRFDPVDLMAPPPDDTPDEQQPLSNIRHAYQHVTQYLYRRSDSLGGSGYNYHMRTSIESKYTMMTQFADRFMLGEFELNSVPLLEEMKRMRKDGRSIEAEGKAKDDRPIACGLVTRAYIDDERKRLVASNQTYAAEMQREADGAGQDSLQARYMAMIMQQTMARKGVARRQTQRANARQRWNW